MLVSGMQRVDVSSPRVACCLQVGRTPSETRLAELHDQYVSSQPRPSAVSVCKGMDKHEAMMEADRELIGSIGLMLDPIAGIIEGLPQLSLNPTGLDADVALGGPVCAGPPPHAIEHAPMKTAQGGFVEEVSLP